MSVCISAGLSEPVGRQPMISRLARAAEYTYFSSCRAITIRWIWLVPS